MRHCFIGLVLLVVLATPALVQAQDVPFDRKSDVIYGRKFGTALTMDVFTPKNPNGAGVIWVVSGGWVSDHSHVNPGVAREFLKRGYVVFAVVHGSQPRYTIPEAIGDMHRAVRFIRANAEQFQVDPDRLGITGGSAGGHLSLMIGTAGGPGDPKAKDPVDRVSSKVAAVACFFPPTDFLNYGKPGSAAAGQSILAPFRAPFDFQEFDQTKRTYERVSPEKYAEIAKQVSPITHVTADDAPTPIIHGDADTLVPIQQAEDIVEKYKAAGVPAELVVRKGAAHGWPTLLNDLSLFADWFDKHLAPKSATKSEK